VQLQRFPYPAYETKIIEIGAIFLDLETNQEKLGISSFGVSITSMEEVFLKYFILI